MKRKLALFMLGVITLNLAGCGETNSIDSNADTNTSIQSEVVKEYSDEKNDVSDEVEAGSAQPSFEGMEVATYDSGLDFASTSYADPEHPQFAINGKVYTLGETTLQELIDDGVPFEEKYLADIDNNVMPNDQIGIEVELDCSWSAKITVRNYGSENVVARDLPIHEIMCFIQGSKTPDILAFNFPFTLTEDELKANAGTFGLYEKSSETYQGIENRYSYQLYNENGDHVSYSYTFLNDSLETVSFMWEPTRN